MVLMKAWRNWLLGNNDETSLVTVKHHDNIVRKLFACITSVFICWGKYGIRPNDGWIVFNKYFGVEWQCGQGNKDFLCCKLSPIGVSPKIFDRFNYKLMCRSWYKIERWHVQNSRDGICCSVSKWPRSVLASTIKWSNSLQIQQLASSQQENTRWKCNCRSSAQKQNNSPQWRRITRLYLEIE